MSAESLILEILKKSGRPLSAKEVQQILKRTGQEFTYYWVKLNLDKLASQGLIVKFRKGRTTRYAVLKSDSAPRFVTLDEFIKYTTSDLVEREALGKELSEAEQKIFERTVSEWLELDLIKIWNHVLKPRLTDNDNILKFISQDPMSLIFQTLKELINLYNNLILRFRNTYDLRARTEMWKRLEDLERIIREFASYVGIPTVPSDITISIKKDKAQIVDEALVRALLKENISGNQIIEPLIPKELRINPLISVGIDGTRFEVHAGRVLGRAAWLLHPTMAIAPVIINAAVASWLEVGEEEPLCHDPRPTPEDWADYTHYKAISDGLILTPRELSKYPESIWKRAAEAAMNAVEYRKARETIKPPPGVLGRLSSARLPSFVILDGRLFPYEHYVDDYLHYHHEQVKIAIQEFNELLAVNDAYNSPYNPTILFCGLVKRSHYEFFKVLLVFWMQKEGLLNDEEFWKVLSCRIPDGWLLWKIFSLISQIRPGVQMLVTFRVRKPFASMVQGDPLKDLLDSVEGGAEEKIMALKDQERWKEQLEKYAQKNNRPMIDMTPYSVICAKGRVAYFFCDVPHLRGYENILLPRFEVLLPYSAQSQTADAFDKIAAEKIAALIYFHKNWAVFHKLYLQREIHETAMVVTREVNSSHEYANKLGRVYQMAVIGLLEKALINLLSRRP
ncbi:hypothetical protein DRO69_12020 [Candidatus Bathyarchaeota archaeon]|nr:MAG: hypothetical protein DRO69_12020 [Candidatus Bathyarchaeota archaeon]